MQLMIICVCRRINDNGVREAVEAGAAHPVAVHAHHGCRINCGKCLDAMNEAIDREQDRLSAASAVPAE